MATASSNLRAVAANGHRFGASTTRHGEDAAIVVYSGAAQDFISCRTGRSGSELSENMLLDTRTKVVVDGKQIIAETQYVATTLHTSRNGTKKAKSVAFGSTQAARFDFGVTCVATGKLEQRLLAQR